MGFGSQNSTKQLKINTFAGVASNRQF